MLIKRTKHGYSKNVQGAGFVGSLSNVFNTVKPALQNIGSYVSQNKDLIAKPILGAVGDLAAFGLTEGGKALLTKIMKSKNNASTSDRNLDPKGVEILQNILGDNISNIIG